MKTKTCPRCGQKVFQEMEICYECLFEFSEDAERVPSDVYEEGQDRLCESEEPVMRVSTASADFSVGIPASGLVIGRGTDCDIVLHSPAVSRRHVLVTVGDGEVSVTDLGARNPAHVGGRKVRGTIHMHEGESLIVCGTEFLLV